MSLLFGKTQLGVSIVTVPKSASSQLVARKYSTPWPLTGPLPHILEAMVALRGLNDAQPAFVNLVRVLLFCVRNQFQNPNVRTSGGAQGLLESVCVYLQNHYQYDINRDSVARQFNITPNHLSHLFRIHGSMTFSSYLTHVRMDRAKHLLRSYNLKLDEITVRCGYRDTPYFCRVFKRFTKVTPAEYRGMERHALITTK
jgi:AraC-like DNA-binding protein